MSGDIEIRAESIALGQKRHASDKAGHLHIEYEEYSSVSQENMFSIIFLEKCIPLDLSFIFPHKRDVNTEKYVSTVRQIAPHAQ